jgi:hypothetical protein
MTTFSTIAANTGNCRIAGIDVDQLLCDIGEASACTEPIELFGLLLRAQQVLAPPGAHRGTHLTDADYAAIVKRYEDAGDVANANIIRRQWQVAHATGDCKSGGNHGF